MRSAKFSQDEKSANTLLHNHVLQNRQPEFASTKHKTPNCTIASIASFQSRLAKILVTTKRPEWHATWHLISGTCHGMVSTQHGHRAFPGFRPTGSCL